MKSQSVFILALLGCGALELTPPQTCTTDQECPSGLFCDEGSCFAPETVGSDAGPRPTVHGVTPLTAVLRETITFTVEGENLPDSLAFFVEECADVERILSGPTVQEFTCTFSWFRGRRAGVVKDRPGGTFLFEFWVDVEDQD